MKLTKIQIIVIGIITFSAFYLLQPTFAHYCFLAMPDSQSCDIFNSFRFVMELDCSTVEFVNSDKRFTKPNCIDPESYVKLGGDISDLFYNESDMCFMEK